MEFKLSLNKINRHGTNQKWTLNNLLFNFYFYLNNNFYSYLNNLFANWIICGMRYCPEPKTYVKKSYCRRFCLQNLKTDKKVLQPQKISGMSIEIFVCNLIWSPYYGCTVFLLWKGIVSNRRYLNRILTKQKSVQAKFVIQSNATVLMTHNKSKVIPSCPV